MEVNEGEAEKYRGKHTHTHIDGVMAIVPRRSVLRNIIKLTSEQWLIGRLNLPLPFREE